MIRWSCLFFLCTAAFLLRQAAHAQRVPEPPLPGEDGPVTPGEAFALLPRLDEIPPEGIAPGATDPVEPPPIAPLPEQMPDIEQLPIPSDGEPMSEIPAIPSPVPPNRGTFVPFPASNRTNPPALPNFVPDLTPADPSMELAARSLWYKSPREARAVSIAQGKPLLLFFAQRLDGFCPTILLNNDLLSIDDFNKFAAAKLILTKLQYPVGSPGKNYSEEKLAALQQFKDFFKVTGFPTLILIDENGRELKRIKGYAQIKDPRSGQKFSTAHVLLDQLKEAVHRWEEVRRYRKERLDNLASQGYRVWTSRAGSALLAKLVEAKRDQIILADENGRWRQVLPPQLILYDAEWARRKQAGLLPARMPKETAASQPPGAALSSPR